MSTELLDMEKRVDSSTRADNAYFMLVDLIMSGELPPGGVVNEAAIADRLGMSRGPIREAMRRLQERRLITREPYMRARVISLDADSLRELFEMREALEGMACRLAAGRMPSEAIDALLKRLEESRAGRDVVLDFHVEIVEASGNRHIINTLCNELYHVLRLYRKQSGLARERKSDAYEEHWQIAKAIKAHDADLAESLMRSHIRRATRNLIKLGRE